MHEDAKAISHILLVESDVPYSALFSSEDTGPYHREGMVQAESECQGSQASRADDIVDDQPDADEDLLQWSHALDFDNYTRYA